MSMICHQLQALILLPSRSFCPKHRPQQLSLNVQGQRVDTICPICMEETQSQVGHRVLLSPCCGRAYFHRLCIQVGHACFHLINKFSDEGNVFLEASLCSRLPSLPLWTLQQCRPVCKSNAYPRNQRS